MAGKITYKRQILAITAPNTTAAGTILEFQVTLDSNYKISNGIAVWRTSGTQGLRIGLKDNSGTLHDLTWIEDWMPATSLAFKDRMKHFPMPAGGVLYTVLVQPVATLTADQVIDVVFWLSDKEQV